ncbi:hypothetical protein ILYODFUR_031497 [Ilyodon furcidens]|uniref:Uncharacterized protein n=1 Tax=Ilyodon furcidens TaxID=33524 RepID=A0ABV0VIR3_9TELE
MPPYRLKALTDSGVRDSVDTHMDSYPSMQSSPFMYLYSVSHNELFGRKKSSHQTFISDTELIRIESQHHLVVEMESNFKERVSEEIRKYKCLCDASMREYKDFQRTKNM